MIYIGLYSFSNFVPLMGQNYIWKKIDSLPPPEIKVHYYQDLKCADSMNCIIWSTIGSHGYYYFRRTTEGGKTWINVYQSEYQAPQICSIAYPDTNLFIATSCNGSIFQSRDKLETVNKIKMDSLKRIGRLNMLDHKFGLGIGGGMEPSKYLYFKTTDGWDSWSILNQPQEFYKKTIESPQMIDSNLFVGNVYDAKYNLTIWVEGNWDNMKIDSALKTSPNYHIFAIYFLDRNIGWAAGGRDLGNFNYTQLILNTEDGGKSWITQRDSNYYAEPLEDIKFLNKDFGMATGGKFSVLVTNNGGSTWETMRIANNDILGIIHSIQITSPTSAFVIRDGDGVYKYTLVTDVEEPKQENSLIYPNPVVDFIEITVGVNGVSHREIGIWDVYGRCVVKNNPLTPFDKGELKIDVSGLAAGMYFVRIGAEVRKFIKL